jgi:hypothetical protein
VYSVSVVVASVVVVIELISADASLASRLSAVSLPPQAATLAPITAVSMIAVSLSVKVFLFTCYHLHIFPIIFLPLSHKFAKLNIRF